MGKKAEEKQKPLQGSKKSWSKVRWIKNAEEKFKKRWRQLNKQWREVPPQGHRSWLVFKAEPWWIIFAFVHVFFLSEVKVYQIGKFTVKGTCQNSGTI